MSSIWSNIFGMSKKEKENQTILATNAIKSINENIEYLGFSDHRTSISSVVNTTSHREKIISDALVDLSVVDQEVLNEINGYKELSESMLRDVVMRNAGYLVDYTIKTFNPSPKDLIDTLEQSLNPDSYSRVASEGNQEQRERLHEVSVKTLLRHIKLKQMDLYGEEFEFDINKVADKAIQANFEYNGPYMERNLLIRNALYQFSEYGAKDVASKLLYAPKPSPKHNVPEFIKNNKNKVTPSSINTDKDTLKRIAQKVRESGQTIETDLTSFNHSGDIFTPCQFSIVMDNSYDEDVLKRLLNSNKDFGLVKSKSPIITMDYIDHSQYNGTSREYVGIIDHIASYADEVADRKAEEDYNFPLYNDAKDLSPSL